MALVASALYLAFQLYFLVLLLRISFEMIQSYAPYFRPRSLVLVAFETTYTLTDPPVKALRKLLPPLQLGNVALDLSVLVIFFACSLAMTLLAPMVI